MPIWLTVLIAIVGLVSTVCSVLGISAYVNERSKRKAQRRNLQEEQEAQEIEAMRHQRYMNDLRSIIREEQESLVKDIATIKEDFSLNTKGIVTILRNDMKKSLDHCKEKGFAGSSDKANWRELYNTYSELGGNHFREFVNEWKQEMEELPPRKTPKKRLVEDDRN